MILTSNQQLHKKRFLDVLHLSTNVPLSFFKGLYKVYYGIVAILSSSFSNLLYTLSKGGISFYWVENFK